MVKIKAVANSIGIAGVLIGLYWGVMAFNAARDLNPQGVYTQHPQELLLIFYFWLACISFPFLFIRHAVLFRDKSLLYGLCISISLGLAMMIFASEGNENSFYIGLAASYLPVHLYNFLTSFRKGKNRKIYRNNGN